MFPTRQISSVCILAISILFKLKVVNTLTAFKIQSQMQYCNPNSELRRQQNIFLTKFFSNVHKNHPVLLHHQIADITSDCESCGIYYRTFLCDSVKVEIRAAASTLAPPTHFFTL